MYILLYMDKGWKEVREILIPGLSCLQGLGWKDVREILIPGLACLQGQGWKSVRQILIPPPPPPLVPGTDITLAQYKQLRVVNIQ